jgi:hypothetical protein
MTVKEMKQTNSIYRKWLLTIAIIFLWVPSYAMEHRIDVHQIAMENINYSIQFVTGDTSYVHAIVPDDIINNHQFAAKGIHQFIAGVTSCVHEFAAEYTLPIHQSATQNITYIHQSESQDTTYIHQLLLRIEQIQTKDNKKFSDGIFPSWREYAQHKGVYKADENVFYTGLVVFTLRKYYHLLSHSDQQICDSIFKRAKPAFAKFKNTKGRPTYNFWRTDRPEVFPNSGFLNLFNKTQNLPDDADDTVIALLALDTPDSIAQYIHKLLIQHANKSRLQIRNTFPAYQNLAAYSTWFGEKMPIDFDVCVISNILYFVNQYQLPWSLQDSASFQLIKSAVLNNQHLKNAAYISPHYHRSPIVVYHLARTLSQIKNAAADSMRVILIQDAKKLFQSSENIMDKVLLNSSLLYLQEKPLFMQIPATDNIKEGIEESDFVFFIADMASMLSDRNRKILSKTALLRFNYYCPAYNIALLLECLLLQQQMSSHMH